MISVTFVLLEFLAQFAKKNKQSPIKNTKGVLLYFIVSPYFELFICVWIPWALLVLLGVDFWIVFDIEFVFSLVC